jgi:hypothetical protein
MIIGREKINKGKTETEKTDKEQFGMKRMKLVNMKKEFGRER